MTIGKAELLIQKTSKALKTNPSGILPMETIDSTACLFKSFDVPRLADIEPEIFVLRSELPQAVLRTEAVTLGWDTVNAIRLKEVNKTLRTFPPPPPFNYKIDGVTISGEFDCWSMERGGSGAIVVLKTVLKTSRMTSPLTPELNFQGGSVKIQLKLQYVPQPPTGSAQIEVAPSSEGDPNYLVCANKDNTTEEIPVVVSEVNYNGPNPSFMQKALYWQAIAAYFNDNLDLFTYIFALVNLNVRAAEAQFQWLKPTHTSYAYFNGANDHSSYFGILNMTDGNSAEGLTNQMPPSAIPGSGNASLLISNERFLQKLVLPGLTKAFVNSVESAFILTSNNTVIELKPGETVELDKVKSGAIWYTPYLQEFTFQIVGDQCQINSKVKVKISDGIHAYILATSYYNIQLVDKREGGQTLNFKEAKPAKTTHYEVIDTWVIVTVAITGLIVAVAGAVAAKLVETILKRVIAAIITVIVTGVIGALPTIIAEVVGGNAANALPPIGPLVAAGTGDIKWPNSSGFTLNSVQLNGSLVIGGNLDSETA